MKMELDDLMKLMKAFGASDLSELKYSDGTENVRLRRTDRAAGERMERMSAGCPDTAESGAVTSPAPVTRTQAAAGTGRQEPGRPAALESAGKEDQGKAVTVPLAGIFYRASKPGAKPYAEEGRPVKKGDTVGLIEAMKMMSEIPSPCDGVVREFRIADGEFAEYGRVLMVIDENA
ncbi:acetyl-CoA carboxylase biotin carboxyl carrier protein [Chordicoccus furentiruminis]|uniref:acetyl-CoA carboxylase biotin carboxyl carrier protein n=1 Tax=Chordicoccus furentiruminis TaxID=2709410 RepID=UPI0023A792C4|nr:biotin/lipoyl-containing protein [Chordicoccus furentiruminis]